MRVSCFGSRAENLGSMLYGLGSGVYHSPMAMPVSPAIASPTLTSFALLGAPQFMHVPPPPRTQLSSHIPQTGPVCPSLHWLFSPSQLLGGHGKTSALTSPPALRLSAGSSASKLRQ
eukprot:958212-Rhodomonas_salina.2